MENTVGKKIRELRHKLKLSQSTIAMGIGISTPAFSKIEAGHTDLSITRLSQIAKYLQISPAALLPGDHYVDTILQDLHIANEMCRVQQITIANLQSKVINLLEENEAIRSRLEIQLSL